jgi:catechol 2,3-dioxygenase-like lactoylglutathione lyase family enzyme
MSHPTRFVSATPVLASLDIERSIEFFCTRLGFFKVHLQQGIYGIVSRGAVQIHFWACSERHIAENTSCRVRVEGIDSLFAECQAFAIVHPNAPLETTPWGTREFGVVDPDGNLVTFAEWEHSSTGGEQHGYSA